MNTVQSITKLETLIATLAGYSAEDYHEIEQAIAHGMERARVSLVQKSSVEQ